MHKIIIPGFSKGRLWSKFIQIGQLNKLWSTFQDRGIAWRLIRRNVTSTFPPSTAPASKYSAESTSSAWKLARVAPASSAARTGRQAAGFNSNLSLVPPETYRGSSKASEILRKDWVRSSAERCHNNSLTWGEAEQAQRQAAQKTAAARTWSAGSNMQEFLYKDSKSVHNKAIAKRENSA